MPRLTRRELSLATLAGAPLDVEIDVPRERAKPKHPEAHLHAACAKYLRTLERMGRLKFHSNLSESYRDPKRAGWFANMSGAPGFPDLTILFPASVVGGPSMLFVELKSDTGRLTPAQEQWRDWLKAAGFAWGLARSVDQLQGMIP